MNKTKLFGAERKILMNESPNFYFSEEEVKSILFAMAMTIGESVVESDCDAIFKKIKQVYPDTIKKYEYILDMNIFWKSPPNMKTFGEK